MHLKQHQWSIDAAVPEPQTRRWNIGVVANRP
jgi:hypothetical protein